MYKHGGEQHNIMWWDACAPRAVSWRAHDVENDIEKMGVVKWRQVVQDRGG